MLILVEGIAVMSSTAKQFENKTKACFLEIPGSTIDRLYDPTAQQLGIRNICDFIGYRYPNIYYIECKTHTGKSISFNDISQYDALCSKIGIQGVVAGILVWFTDIQKVYWIDIEFCRYVREHLGSKSVGIRHLEYANGDNGRMLEVPSIFKRVYPQMDLTVLAKV